MRFFSSPLRRAMIAGVLALVLSGCAAQETKPAAMMLSGGGEVSSDHGAASSEEPESSRPDDDDPSFQEPPSPEEPSQSAGVSAPPPSSSEASSSQAPPSSSSQPEEEEDPGPEEENGEDEDEDDGEGGNQDEDEEEDGPDEDEPDRWGGESSGWEDLKVKNNGAIVSDSAVSIVARIVQNEVGGSFPEEAVKAQAVAAYTFVRYHNSIAGDIPSVGMSSTSGVSDRVARLVREVAGEQISYNGKPILASYCAISAGTTASSQSVWGSPLSYLVPVESEGDESASGFRVTVTKSAHEVRTRLENSLGVDLDGVNPRDWFDILSYWDKGPYVNKVSIGGRKETTGRVIRESILNLRSAAFKVEYDKGSDKFSFTTYGYGHGVGMSQMGAKYYAEQGWDHVEILEHYYSGTTVG